MLPGEILSISTPFLCGRKMFRHLLSTFPRPGDFLTKFVNFPCHRETYQLVSTFRAASRNFVNFRQLSVRRETFC